MPELRYIGEDEREETTPTITIDLNVTEAMETLDRIEARVNHLLAALERCKKTAASINLCTGLNDV